jgi:uncharacterized damage-inducible protein DinB
MAEPEYWLRGPVAGVATLLQPVAHSLLQAREDVTEALTPLTADDIWTRRGGAASIGFHVRHLCGSLDRLLTYARGDALSSAQHASLQSESDAGSPPADARALIALVHDAVERALAQVRATREDTLTGARAVGRQRLPSTTLGLLFHAAEHATRHAGQIITTAKIVPIRESDVAAPR